MSKKNFPNSLELLLDTMCNTFGGIMFIAISLVVMSQMITRQQKSMTREEISKTVIEQMKSKIETLLQENSQLSKVALNVSINTSGIKKEKKDAILLLKSAKEKNLKLEESIERLNSKIAFNIEQGKHLDERIRKLTEELDQKRKTFQAKKVKIQKNKTVLLYEIKKLEKVLKNLRPKVLRFAKNKVTQKRPYWVLIQQNKIYRLGDERFPRKGEVELKFSSLTNKVWLKSVNGTEITDEPEAVLSFLFKGVDKEQYFVNIVSDVESFSSLMITRQFLRNHKFLNNWSINPSFELSVSNHVRYSASE